MFAIGVGNALEEELRIIASDPVKDHYHYTADFKTMNQIADKLQVKICGKVFFFPHFSKCGLLFLLV